MSRTLRFLSWLEIAWFFVLPWPAYWVVLESYESTPTGTVLLGWSAVLVYDIIKIGMVLRAQSLARRPLFRLLLILVPTAVLTVSQILRGGDFRSFILELATLEFTVLVFAFPTALMFVKNDQGRTAWQDIGAIPIMLAVLFGFGIWGFVATWWANAPGWDTHRLSLILLLAALAYEFAHSLINLNQFAKRKATLPDISAHPLVLGILLGQIILWWIFPVLVNLIAK